MRPIKLTMQAFASYGTKTTLNFDDLSQNLFLICGETGAGKTTIFDAMVFALYGEASSTNNVKKGLDLQSQYVGTDVEPYVEFEFSEYENGETKHYKIYRSPQHQKNHNKNLSVETVELTLDDGQIFNGKKNETDQKIIEIIGLTKAQFMQVVMIAQGEYMDILRDKTSKKKEIFRKLFNTGIYNQIVENLKEKLSDKANDVQTIKVQCQQILNGLAIPNDEQFTDLKALQIKLTQADDNLSIADLEQLHTALLDLNVTTKSWLNDLDQERQKIAETQTAAAKQLHLAEVLVNKYTTLEEQTAKFDAHVAKESEMNQKAQLSKDIGLAYQLNQQYADYQNKVHKQNGVTEELVANQKRYPEVCTTLEQNKTALLQAEETLHVAKKNADLLENEVNKAQVTFKEIEELKRQLVANQKNLDQKVNEQTNLETALTTINQEAKTNEVYLQAHQNVPLDLKQVQVNLDLINDFKTDLKQIINDAEKITALKNQIEIAYAEELEKAAQNYHLEDQKYHQIYLNFIANQAGYLAAHLKDGEPCPVCGSKTHPSLAHQIDANEYTKDDVVTAEQTLKAAQAKLDQISAKVAKANAQCETLVEANATHLNNYQKRLSKIADLIKPELLVQFNEGHYALTMFLATLEEVDTELTSHKDELEKIQIELTNLATKQKALLAEIAKKEETKDINANAIKELENQKVALTTQIKALTAQLTFASLNEALNKLQSVKQNLAAKQKAYDVLKNQNDQYQQETARLKALIETAQKDLPVLTKESEEAQLSYDALLVKSQMQGATWQALVRQYPEDAQATFKSEVDNYVQQKAELKGAINQLCQDIGQEPRPDLTSLQKQVLEIQQKYTESDQKYNLLAHQQTNNEHIAKELSKLLTKRQKFAADYDVLESLYSRLKGTNTGSRMGIETFVQRYYLARIIDAANQRFEKMSAGQYLLKLKDDEEAAKGGDKGLDLMVYSLITGKTREIGTLSGGESFMAALSLALGMADQISENSAAINIDMMFIDEGFGSLDTHSRNQAIKVLKQMADGSKMIGIISHVSELEQEIENKLIVEKDNEGSHAHWVIS